MVQLEFHTSAKPTLEMTVDGSPTAKEGDAEVPERQNTPIMIGEVEFLATSATTVMAPLKTMDWAYIRRIAMVQMLLALVSFERTKTGPRLEAIRDETKRVFEI